MHLLKSGVANLVTSLYPAYFPRFAIYSYGPVSEAFLKEGINNFLDALNWMHQLPYGRNTNRADYMLTFLEKQGTCSTKHAALAALGEENQQPIQLKVGICKIGRDFDPKIEVLLDQFDIDFFPEAHSYLSCPGGTIDITFPHLPPFFSYEVLEEYNISPEDIGDLKVMLHKDYLQKWMKETGVISRFSFEDLWNFREQWISGLNKK